jgi:hypothetical protein
MYSLPQMLFETKLCLKICNVLFYRANSCKALVLINGVVGHPRLPILRKCENEIYVKAGLCRLQRLMDDDDSCGLQQHVVGPTHERQN